MSTDHPPEEDPLLGESEEDRSGARVVTDFVRRMAWAGLGAVVMSEEGIRRLAGQAKLPKEALGFILQQAEKTKDDVGRIVSEEVRKFLQSDRLRDELLKMIAGMTLEVRAEVKLVPDRVKDDAPSLLPKVKLHEFKTKYSAEQGSRAAGEHDKEPRTPREPREPKEAPSSTSTSSKKKRDDEPAAHD